MLDPFARPEVQGEQLQQQPSGALPLAVFSSVDSAASSNSLMPAGSKKLFKFGSFSTSPSQGYGFASPKAPATAFRGGDLSPFAGFEAPNGKVVQNGSASAMSEKDSSGSNGTTYTRDSSLATLSTNDLGGTSTQIAEC